ncbi:hypothetical protein [Endozoicomonas numazuensis]|uniref:Uncharacterized protein n=1 Tax=Endozoicomonas numazuensis TaxID=1137799 RepID=A0A081NL37_9GAMM|nr:hypothetical protein [Endozoicomonas numazuensis]KEQ19160.1 hypothetical protein GZ78_03955 [Endozoicomonas numazuensis]
MKYEYMVVFLRVQALSLLLALSLSSSWAGSLSLESGAQYQVLSLLAASVVWLSSGGSEESILSGNPLQVGGGTSSLRNSGQESQSRSKRTQNKWSVGWQISQPGQPGQSGLSSGSGGKKPPEGREGVTVKKTRSVFTELLSAMDDVISAFQVELDKDEELKLIFSFDLDGTWFQMRVEMDGLEDFAVEKGLRDEGLVWTNELLIKLQQKWYAKFARFHHKNKGRVLLVQNTARVLTNYREGDVPVNDPGPQSISLDMTNVRFLEESTFTEQLRAHEFRVNNSERKKILIPAPDILILGSGKVIQFDPTLEESHQRARVDINSELDGWVTKDWEEARVLLAGVKQTYSFKSAFSSKGLTVKAYASEASSVYSQEAFDWRGNHVVVTPLTDANNILKQAYFSDVTANKGSTLLMVLNILRRELVAEGKKPPLLFAFGDSLMDIPMLRPDLLMSSMADVSESAELLRKTRFQELGFASDLKSLGIFWVCSVVTSQEFFLRELRNLKVETALVHSRVVFGNGLGLLGLLQQAQKQLKRQLSPEHIHELQNH